MLSATAFQFHTPSSVLIVGPSASGKTVFTTRLLTDNLDLFATPPPKIHYYYGSWQKSFERLKETGVGQARRIACHGRSDDGGQQRQDRVGHFHQTLASPQHHGPLPVSGHVSSRQIRKEHFEKRALHRGLQESQRSIGCAERGSSGVSRQVASRVGRVSSRDVSTVWLSGAGSPSCQQRRSKARESFVKRGGIHAHVSFAVTMQTRSQRRFAIFRSLCEDMLEQRCEDWYDRIAMTKVFQCDTYREVWHDAVMPYNETYFREEIQSLWNTAGHLARRHELPDRPSNQDARTTRFHCLSTTL